MSNLVKTVTIFRATNVDARHVVEFPNQAWFDGALADVKNFLNTFGAQACKGDTVRFERVEMEFWFDRSARFATFDKEAGMVGAWRRREESAKVELVAEKVIAVKKGVASWK